MPGAQLLCPRQYTCVWQGVYCRSPVRVAAAGYGNVERLRVVIERGSKPFVFFTKGAKNDQQRCNNEARLVTKLVIHQSVGPIQLRHKRGISISREPVRFKPPRVDHIPSFHFREAGRRG